LPGSKFQTCDGTLPASRRGSGGSYADSFGGSSGDIAMSPSPLTSAVAPVPDNLSPVPLRFVLEGDKLSGWELC